MIEEGSLETTFFYRIDKNMLIMTIKVYGWSDIG